MPLQAGDKLGPYEIVAAIGAGGMGEVFRASDPRLGRDIAIKTLPAAMAHDVERLSRFQREARAVAALNHPHIVTIFSVEEADGAHFITMELVDGHPLDHLIPIGGMRVEQIVEVASALADALAAAHEKGIVHRDLKPANVMVSKEGRVKVLDFGLAKDINGAIDNDATMTSAHQTKVGLVMGTPAYMSPEQAAGRLVDHRTDIFSMGILLHEMATGRQPFDGASTAELLSSILRDTPPSVVDLRSDLPSDLARIIRRCLEKDPRHRVQTARDVANEFRDLAQQLSMQASPANTSSVRTAASRVETVKHSGAYRAEEGFWVAVLPFKRNSGDADLKALAEGLSEDIVTGLSRFSYLRVIAQSSTARYANQAVDPRDLGKELGARYVMEGSLRQAGSKLRLAVQLVDTHSGAHIWAETYEHAYTPETAFQLQDDLVPRIVSTVADQYGILPRSMGEVLRHKNEADLTPHEAVLRAFSYFERITPDEHATVRRILERAVQQAPEHADCWAMLCMIYRAEFAQGFNTQPDPLRRALAAARRAEEAGPLNHLAHSAKAVTLFFLKEKLAFRVAAERAIALNPMDGSTSAYLGLLMAAAGDWDYGCALVESSMKLNPNHPGWFHLAAFANAYFKGRYREALDAALRVNTPGYFHAHGAMAAALGQMGEYEAARKSAQELLALRPDFSTAARYEFNKWYDPDQVELIIDGLRKAGMEFADAAPPTATATGAVAAPHCRLRRTMTDADLVQIVDAALADAARRSGEHLICRAGCAQCCIGAFEINALDAERLGRGYEELRRKDPERFLSVRLRVEDYVRRTGAQYPGDLVTGVLDESPEGQARFEEFANEEVCPVLDPVTLTCDLYEHRPMTCRVFGPPVRAGSDDGQGGLGLCELCFTQATAEEIAACEMVPDPDQLEEKLLREMAPNCANLGQTTVGYALSTYLAREEA